MKIFGAWLFFILFGAFLAVGTALAMSGKGLLVGLIGLAIYIAMFVQFGCKTH